VDDVAASLPSTLADRVEAELADDERLIWAGQPRPDLMVRSAACCLVPFGLLFGGLPLVGTIVVFIAGAPVFLLFGAAPFVGLGIFLICSPLWLRRKARNTVYALTDRRAIIWDAGWYGAFVVRSYASSGLGRIARRERADGSGDLIFEDYPTRGSTKEGATCQGFLCIDHVREVEDLVRRTLLAGHQPTT
jgi:hypothetical protein